MCMLSHVLLFAPHGLKPTRLSQTRILEWVALSSSRGSSHPGDQTPICCIACIGRRIFLPLEPTGKPMRDGEYL